MCCWVRISLYAACIFRCLATLACVTNMKVATLIAKNVEMKVKHTFKTLTAPLDIIIMHKKSGLSVGQSGELTIKLFCIFSSFSIYNLCEEVQYLLMSNTRGRKGLELSVISSVLYTLSFLQLCFSDSLDTLRVGEKLYSNQTLVSSGGVFELGFFAFADSSSQYLGIWFKSDQTKKPVWVANRDYPMLDSSGVLQIREDGNMVISDIRMSAIIVNTGALATSSNTSATIYDSGNLILFGEEQSLWQSFDYPSDTFLPGMKVGLFGMGTSYVRSQFLVSWRSPNLPTTGLFGLGINPTNKSQVTVSYSDKYQVVGVWNGHTFRFLFQTASDSYNFSYESNDKDVFLTFSNRGNNISSWFVLAPSGDINEYIMTRQGISIVNNSWCGATPAISPKDCFNDWPFLCRSGDAFLLSRGSMPNSTVVRASRRLNLSDCKIMCRSDCSCTAYASLYDDGVGCRLYYGDKSDLVSTSGKENSSTIYVRGVTHLDSDYARKRRLYWIVLAPVLLFILPLVVVLRVLCWRWRKTKYTAGAHAVTGNSFGLIPFASSSETGTLDAANASSPGFGTRADGELPLFSFSHIVKATDNFSTANKLGEGGFGPVYKGILSGQEVAIKRHSEKSGQGSVEFKNEVQLISMLQHINLVELIGCCVERGEKMLIYNFMPNRSLDSFIFDPVKRKLIAWQQRLHIIQGISQGILYLHKYSRVQIIHRDLKTSNILLDSHMNPKISDFGMARICSDNESSGKTKRIAGTYGYMSPEYGVHGHFSTKSDVYSFGVILLEIISGRKNTSFCEPNSFSNLLGHAWELWEAERFVEFMDPVLADSFSMTELMLCIQVGLLCVQDVAEDRPSMSSVISILSNEGVLLPEPKHPAFSLYLNATGNASKKILRQKPSFNTSFTGVEGR